jgi:hypothetical protein
MTPFRTLSLRAGATAQSRDRQPSAAASRICGAARAVAPAVAAPDSRSRRGVKVGVRKTIVAFSTNVTPFDPDFVEIPLTERQFPSSRAAGAARANC